MPIISKSPYCTSHLVYDAPVDEKTKKLREEFKVDEKTGYPEHYNWRPMARLGRSYKPEDPFVKFDPYNPNEDISTKIAVATVSILTAAGIHCLTNYLSVRKWYSRPYIFLGSSVALTGSVFWTLEVTQRRQGIRNSIVRDYTKKHPERFGETYRPKLREVLLQYYPCR